MLTSISNLAFYYCSSLTSVTISDSDYNSYDENYIIDVSDTSDNATYYNYYWYKQISNRVLTYLLQRQFIIICILY